MSRTNFNGPKDVGAIEVRLYIKVLWNSNITGKSSSLYRLRQILYFYLSKVVCGVPAAYNETFVSLICRAKPETDMSQSTTNPIIRLVQPVKTQIGLRIRAVWSESSLIACAFYSLRDKREPLPYRWMYRLIWDCASHTGLIVSFVVLWLSIIIISYIIHKQT